MLVGAPGDPLHGERATVRLGAWRFRSWFSSCSSSWGWSAAAVTRGSTRPTPRPRSPSRTSAQASSSMSADAASTWSARAPAVRPCSSRRASGAAPMPGWTCWRNSVSKPVPAPYDRAGIGASDPIPGVHDAGDEIGDLERLLDRGRIAPPYVLVGHSYGGVLARLFAHAHPDQTGGIVLIDAEGRDDLRRVLAAWPKSLAPSGFGLGAEPVIRGVDVRASSALASDIRSLGDTPLVVITAARNRELECSGCPAGCPPDALRQWRVMQAELASTPTDHAHVVALRSDHFIFRDQPALVLRAVRAVVRAVREMACSRHASSYSAVRVSLPQLAPSLAPRRSATSSPPSERDASGRTIATSQKPGSARRRAACCLSRKGAVTAGAVRVVQPRC